MTFGALGALGVFAVFAAAAAALTVLYLFRLHRRRIEVPFVGLWRKVLSQREPTSWLEKLRRVLSLLIQLALAALLALALGDPRLAGAARGARSVVVLVDCSASMQARDLKPSRLERAKEEARRLVRSLGRNDSAMVVRLDAEPVPVSGWESDLRALERAIDGLGTTDTAADWDGGLALANDALRGRPGPTVVVVSDGGLGDTARQPAGDLRFIQIGTAADNVGVTALGVRRYPVNKSSYEVLLEMVNHGAHRTQRTLTLEADGEVVDVAKLEFAPGEKLRRFYPNLSGASSRLVARLEPHDALTVDDTAYALLPPRKKQRVLLVTTGNLFLEGGLLLEDGADIDKLAPAAYAPESARDYDVVVFDRFAPPAPPRALGVLYIAPPAEKSPFAVRKTIARPLLTEMQEGHPLLRWITLTDVNIAESEVFALERGDVALASSVHEPIIVAGTRAGQKMMAIGFDLRRSDLPMRVAFPVLLNDALDWFGGDDASQLVGTYRTGRAWRVAPPLPGAAEVLLEAPDGAVARAPVGDDGFATFFGRRAGFHKVRAGGAEAELAANLADPAESDLSPRQLAHASPPELSGSGPHRQLWAWLLAVALLITIGEWLSYQRRWTV